MVKPHRQLFDRLGPPPVPAVVLDTPYGFQANADDISDRAVAYFADSVGRQVTVAGLRRKDGGDPVRWEASLSALARAQWVFAGPGSPTYALRQWARSDVPELLADKVEHGGCVVFASAAALTLGTLTVPVYEIYKVGQDPHWEKGLDLLAFLGPEVAIIPHYDNAEGGNHDTRYCYLGETRLALMEEQMSESGWVLGVDEHTACVFDLDVGSLSIVGNGVVTVRRQGRSSVVANGTTLSIEQLTDLASGKKAAGAPSAPLFTPAAGGAAPTALHGEIRRLEAEFDRAVDRLDVDDAIRAVLELDDTLVAWAGDTTQSDAGERGRSAMRRMVARLGELAKTGARDPRSMVGGFVEALLRERASARSARRFDDADRVRDALLANGIEVRDTPNGTLWDIAGNGSPSG
jgi:cyanophycinase-like exopeptidase